MLINKTNAVLFFSLIAISACTSNEIGESKDVAQDKIYQQYSIKFTEGNDKVMVHGQFRFAGSNGTTLVLSKPSQLSFDNEVIKVDSSGPSGAYYELNKPVNGFYGKHHFIFSDINNKKFDNDFTFDTFRLVNVPATASKKQGLSITFASAALQPGDHIELASTGSDSSFTVRREGTETGNAILIPAKQLMRQKNNEVKLEATLYRKITLQQNTAEGGDMELRYVLKPVTVKLAE